MADEIGNAILNGNGRSAKIEKSGHSLGTQPISRLREAP
jgi:hypothetical protein